MSIVVIRPHTFNASFLKKNCSKAQCSLSKAISRIARNLSTWQKARKFRSPQCINDLNVIEHIENDDKSSEILSAMRILSNFDFTSDSAEPNNTASVSNSDLEPLRSDDTDSDDFHSTLQQASSDALESYDNSCFAFVDPDINDKGFQ